MIESSTVKNQTRFKSASKKTHASLSVLDNSEKGNNFEALNRHSKLAREFSRRKEIAIE